MTLMEETLVKHQIKMAKVVFPLNARLLALDIQVILISSSPFLVMCTNAIARCYTCVIYSAFSLIAYPTTLVL